VVDDDQVLPCLHDRDRGNAVDIGRKPRDVFLRHRRYTVAAFDFSARERLATEQHFDPERFSGLDLDGIGKGDDFQFMSKDLACIVRPGTKAEVLERSAAVAFVRASNAAFGGCKGYVKTEFLSAN